RQLGTTIGVVGLGLIQDNQYETYLNGHLSSLNLPVQALSGLKKALIDAGPFSGHGIAFSSRVSHAPFAHDFQQIVIKAYDNGMTAVAIGSAIIVVIGGVAAALLLQRNPKSADITIKEQD
ncbi:MAG TPA: MFS transporter, partial [Lactobacillus sp.]|nr:MFS transporter [Lactobacillus sp.]